MGQMTLFLRAVFFFLREQANLLIPRDRPEVKCVYARLRVIAHKCLHPCSHISCSVRSAKKDTDRSFPWLPQIRRIT